jgi:hypothetical protein
MDRGEDFVLLEVLGEVSYRRAHLPGAIRFTDAGKAPELFPDKSTFVGRLLLELHLTLLDAGRPGVDGHGL